MLGRIGYLSEDRDLPEWMSVGELILYTKAYYPRWDDAYAEELRAMFGLDARQKISSLSRGQLAQAGLLTFLICLAAIAITYAVSVAAGAPEGIFLTWKVFKPFSQPAWLQIPLIITDTLLGSWILMGLAASIAMSGRGNYFMALFIALVLGLFLFVVVSKSMDPTVQTMHTINQWLGAFFVAALVIFALWSYQAAYRRGFIGGRIIFTVILLVGVGLALAYQEYRVGDHSWDRITDPLLLYVLPALYLPLPLATAPLAVAWNRHR